MRVCPSVYMSVDILANRQKLLKKEVKYIFAVYLSNMNTSTCPPPPDMFKSQSTTLGETQT